MAERLTITIDGDSSGLTKALKSAETRLNSFNERVTKNSRALTDMAKRMASASASFGAYSASVAQMTAANQRAAASMTSLAARVNSTSAANRRYAQSARAAASSNGIMNVGVRDLIMGMTSLNTLLYTSAFLFGGIVKSTIDANAKFEKMNILMKNISGGANEMQKQMIADKSMDYLWDLADNAPFKIEALSDSFVKLKAAGIDPTKGSLQALVDTVSYFGGDSEQMKRAGVALSQMLSKGKVTAEELRQQLGDAVPNAMKDMAKALDMTIPELDAKMKKGLVLSADAVPKLMTLWQKQYGGGAARMMNTWDGVMARMSNSWTRTMIRITANEGNDSLFSTLKKQAIDLTTFLSSQKGDEFLGDLSAGIGKMINKIVEGIKWVYQYRDAIISIGGAIAKLWVMGRVIALVGSFGGAISSAYSSLRTFTMIIPNTVAFLTRLYNVKNGVQLVALLFGTNVTKAANALGLFNAQGAISVRVLGSMLGAIGLVTGVLTAMYYAYQYGAQKVEASRQADLKYSNALEGSKKAAFEVKQAVEALNNAHGDEIIRSRELVKQKMREINVRLANARAALAEANKTANAAQTKADAANPYGPTSKNPYLNAMGTVAKVGWNALTGQTNMKMGMAEPALLANNKAQANLKTLNDAYATDLKSLDTLTKGLYDNMFNSVPEPKSDTTPLSGKPEKDKLGSTDDKRGEYVSALNKIAELRAKQSDLKTQNLDPEHKETNKAQEAYADNSDEINNANKAIANKITSQKQLNAVTSEAQSIVKQLTVDNRELTKTNADQIRDMEGLARLHSEVTDQTLRAQEAVGQLDESYNSVNSQVERYMERLKKQNAALLGSSDAAVRAKAAADIEAAGIQRRIELIGDEASRFRQSRLDIEDSLKTEDQVREDNYQREVQRVQALLAALTGKSAEEIRMAQELNLYLGALQKKNEFQKKGPFAQWAVDASDLHNNIQRGLVGSMDSFIDGLAEGKMNFAEFAASLVKDLTKIVLKALIAKAILGALGLSPVETVNVPQSSFTGLGSTNTYVPANHTGGLVGSEMSHAMNVPASIFKFAKKYHTGGFPGLQSGEVPIIAKKGEGVFTQEQMKALGTSGGASMGAAPSINIINQTSTPVSQEQAQPRFDGEKYIIDVILKHADKPGPLREKLGKSNG